LDFSPGNFRVKNPWQTRKCVGKFNSELIMYHLSPLILQTTRRSRQKPTFFFKVMLALGVHVVVICGLLLQGCKDTKDGKDISAVQPLDTSIETIPAVTAPALAPHNVAQNPPPTAPSLPPPPVVAPATKPAAPADAAVYTVKSGDTLVKIAKWNHTSYKKIMAINGLKTTTLKAGQILKLPSLKPA
jgi:LysM repeat protein